MDECPGAPFHGLVNVRASHVKQQIARADGVYWLFHFNIGLFFFDYMMRSKNVKLFCFLLMLPSFLGDASAQRSPIDVSLRGNSFGLENFLFQSYENTESTNSVHTVKSKRVRPPPNSRVIINERSQTYGLENLRTQIYESSRLKPSTPKPIQDLTKRRPIEPTAESNKIKENFAVKPETVFEVTSKPEAFTQEIATERIRKRIMMRRRRKRPSNTVQSEDNTEITGNAILKPARIPIYPQSSKLIIKTKLPDEDTINRVGVKPTAQAPTESNIPEEIIEQEEPTTIVTEPPVISTTKLPKTTEKPSTINLKTFLKQQTETLSLSELLQTQNLSLSDLLRGNKDASAILKARQQISSTTAATTTTTSVRRKLFNRIGSDKTEPPPKKTEVVEASTSRPKYNAFQPKISGTKAGEQVNSKPNEENLDEIPKQIKRPIYTSGPAGIDPKNRLNELRMKLRNFQKKPNSSVSQLEITSAPPERDETIEPVTSKTTELPLYKKNRISFKSANNPELPLILPNKIKTESDDIKRPERITNWTSRLPPIKRIQDRLKTNDAPVKPVRIPVLVDDSNKNLENDEEPTTTSQINDATEEQNRKPEPKDELIELLKFGQNADRLQRILSSRNMTIQELLDNREKPFVQTNISALFSKHQKQIPVSTQPTLFDSLPDFKIEEMDVPDKTYDEPESEAEPEAEPEAEESAPNVAKVLLIPGREAKHLEFPMSDKGVSQLNLQPDDLSSSPFNTEDSDLWKLSEKSIYYGHSYGYGDFPVVQQTERSKNVKTTELTDSDIILLETIRRNQETNRKFKLDLDDFPRQEEEPQTEDIEKSYIPPAVKSAILASGVVMGIALFVFIAIFAACGWKQRQIRLKSSASSLGGTLNKREKTKRTLSPVSFKDTHSYKKTLDFGDETSESGTSNTSSYLWSTLKNTFTSRASTLKSRLEKEEKLREDKVTLRRNESRRKESRSDDRPITDNSMKKIDRDRNIINTSFNFKRSSSNNNVSHFNECVHGY